MQPTSTFANFLPPHLSFQGNVRTLFLCANIWQGSVYFNTLFSAASCLLKPSLLRRIICSTPVRMTSIPSSFYWSTHQSVLVEILSSILTSLNLVFPSFTSQVHITTHQTSISSNNLRSLRIQPASNIDICSPTLTLPYFSSQPNFSHPIITSTFYISLHLC